LGLVPQSHATSYRVQFCHEVKPLELQMQVPVPKTPESEVLGLFYNVPTAGACGRIKWRFS